MAAPRVAEMLESGTGIEKDETVAFEWRVRAFEMKAPHSAIALSRIYRHGLLGQRVDLKKAKSYAGKDKAFTKLSLESRGLSASNKKQSLLRSLFKDQRSK